MIIDPEYDVIIAACPGEIVWDMFTRRNVKILRVSFDESPAGCGCMAYWLECDEAEMERTGGGRYPWEISPPRPEKT